VSESTFGDTKYKLVKKISEGTSAHVYIVEVDGRQYALKHLKTTDQASILRFRSESATLARLNHPNLVKIFEVGESDGRPFIVMEYLDGNSLEVNLKNQKTLSETEALSFVTSTAGALSELHKNNLVHRDIKPANIVISKIGIKLIDVGLIGDVDQIKSETPLVGTPLYCSPEQTKILNKDVSFSSDLYSLGIVFFEMLTGIPPFTGSLSDILQQHSSTPVPNLRLIKPGIKESVVVIIEKLLSKDPDDRYQSAKGLLNDLDRLREIDEVLQKKGDPKLGGKDKNTSARIQYVERTAEIQELQLAWSQAKKGDPGVFIVQGPSGSGKTRLCSEFISRASDEQKGILVLKGKSQFFDRDMPFGAVRQAIDSFIEATVSEPTKNEVLQKVTAAAEGHEEALSQFSKSLHKTFKKIKKINIETDVEGEKEKFFTSIAEFFVKLSQQWKGLVLFIDDLQWLDGSSIQVIERLMNQSGGNPIFILGTARNDTDSLLSLKALESTLGKSIKGSLELGGFTQEQMLSLLSGYLGASQLEPKIVEVFFNKSAGNPFIATEYLRAVVEQGFLNFKNNQWQLTGDDLEKLAFSKDVYDLILKRIDSSSPDLKNLLQYAALYGNTFVAPDITRVAKLDSTTAEQVLLEAERQGLVDRLTTNKWKFSHDKIPESLRQKVTSEEHRKMCDELSAFYRKKQDKTDDEIFILARLAASGNFENDLEFTIHANIEAGQLSLANHAHSQAYVFFKCAFNLSKKFELQKTLLLDLSQKLAICATMITDWALAEEGLTQALKLSTTQEELGSSLILKVWIKKTRADFTTAWETFRRACDVIGRPYPSYLHWKLLNLVWMIFICFSLELTKIKPTFLFKLRRKDKIPLNKLADLYFDAQYCAEYRSPLDFLLLSLKILNLGQLSGRKRELSLGYACLGHVCASFSIRTLAVPFLDLGVKLAEELNDPVVKASCTAIRINGLIASGVTFDETTEFMKHYKFLQRYLTPQEAGRFQNARTYILMFKGRNLEAMEFQNTYMNIQNPEAARLAALPLLNGLHQYWLNLSLLGRAGEAQAVKNIVIKKSSNYRYIPVAGRHLATFEIQARRYAEEVDEIALDLQEYVAGTYKGAMEVNGKFINTHSVFLDLYDLSKATNREEEFSRRRRFKKGLQRVYFMLYSPIYRINYYLLKAMYSRITGKPAKAEKWLRTCEKIAAQTGHLRIMFEVHREWARIFKKTENFMQMKNHLAAGLQLALENKWIPAETAMLSEFGEFAESILTQIRPEYNTEAGLTKHQTQLAKHSSPVTSALARQTSAPSASASVNNSSVIGKGELEEVRFVEALLKVNQAFVSSLDSVEQSKAVLVQIVKLFAAERGFVFIKNEMDDGYRPLSAKNAQGQDLKSMTGFSSTVIKKAFETSETVIIASSDEAEALGSESAILSNLRSIIVTPLKIENRILGAVYLDSSLTKGLFTKRDTHLFSTLANNISVALELSRMAKVELEKAALQKELEIQAAVATESKKVQVLVENMKQALFSISSDGTIIEPVSRYSETVFGKKIGGGNIFDVLYPDLQSQKEQIDMVKAAVTTVFGEDDLQWDLSESNIPKRVKLKTVTANGENNEQILKAQPAPIWDKDNKLEKILFVVEDITNLEALEQSAKSSSLRASMLEDIFENKPEQLQEFFVQEMNTINTCREYALELDESKFKALLRDLHTLKGNARLYKLKQLSDQIHQTESVIAIFKEKNDSHNEVSVQILNELPKISAVATLYKQLFQRIFKTNTSSIQKNLTELALLQLNKRVSEVAGHLPVSEVEQLQHAVHRLLYHSVKDSMTKFEDMVKDLSAQLNKKVTLQVTGDALASPHQITVLQECLLHLIRNSLDHGLETPEDRVKKGKPEMGTIRIDCSEDASSLHVIVSDDGRGIDGDHIAKNAVKKGLLTEAAAEALSRTEKINLIFMPNFSTTEVATDISGRGVGMDVVKESIKKLGGTLDIETKIGQGSNFKIAIASKMTLDKLGQVG